MFPAQYHEWDARPPKAFRQCQPFDLKLPIQPGWKSAKHRVLFVLEHVDSDDIRSKKLMNSTSGNWVTAAVKLGMEYAAHLDPDQITCAAINFNYFKTYDLPPQEQQQADRHAAKRVHKFIDQMDPHTIIVFGDNAAQALIEGDPRILLLNRGRPTKINGRKWTTTISLSSSYQKKKSDSEDEEEEQESQIDQANMLGFVGRCVGNALAKRVVYKVNVESDVRYINTIEKFDKLFARLMEADQVAVDTETTSLGRIKNKVLTIQFAFSSKRAYVIPIGHKDSPFDEEETKYIKKKLRKFFVRPFDPLEKRYDQFLLGQNLKFDLTVIRQWLQIHVIHWRVWDLMAGEYLLDENMKTLSKNKLAGAPVQGAYGLAWFCAWYNFDFYENNPFSKSERHTIEHRAIKEPGLLEYMGMDAQVCFAIKRQQCLRASRSIIAKKPYGERYEKFAVTQMNNLIQIESVMEHRGDQLDIKWLLKLKDKNGPMLTVRKEFEGQFRESKAVRKANKNIVKAAGIQPKSMWGQTTWMFDINKPAHKQELFIDQLKLAPLAWGKVDGQGNQRPKFDKFFQEAHKDVKEIEIFTQLSQINTLSNTYVNGFYQKLTHDPDVKTDYRIRPGFGFTGTVTGRSNSYDPNLQNIPARGKFAKYIKRLFVAPRGCLTLKMDYSAHEVRMWAIIAGDKDLCSLFINGRWLRQQYRRTGEEIYLKLMDTEGDIHKLNCQYFFQVKTADVTKEQRNSVKSIVFGAIYGRGAKAIAEQTKAKVDDIKEILVKFFKRFAVASKWLEDSKAYAVKHGYTYSPIWRVRHMYTQLFGLQNFNAATERRGCNAPVQGFAADLGHTAALLYQIHIERVVREFNLDKAKVLRAGVNTFVHDAIKTDAPYEYFLVCLQVLQWCATTGLMQYYKTHWNIKFPCEVEVDFEIAGHDQDHWKWSWHEGDGITYDKGEEIGGGLKHIVRKALADQKDVYPDLDIEAAEKLIWKAKKNKPLMDYLDKHYPVLADWPDATHIDTKSKAFKNGIGKMIKEAA